MYEKTYVMHICENNAHISSIYKTWDEGIQDQSITHIFMRIQKVLCLVVEGGSSN